MTKFLLGAVFLFPGLAAAQGPLILPTPQSNVLPPAMYGEAKPAKFPSSNRPNAHLGDPTLVPQIMSEPYQSIYNRHINAPHGTPTPIGCSTFYTEFKFVFGSCRQFFGTGDSTPGTVFTPYNRDPRFP
ncbi:hypothetical protein [Zavarzinella formosa]|uniref:hypothetical protein n=1 Tax=Zavarzinella formosa TaxID=360055 RepID=UPI000363B044|nr:hypothetical protein [Zavarzinella formosa]